MLNLNFFFLQAEDITRKRRSKRKSRNSCWRCCSVSICSSKRSKWSSWQSNRYWWASSWSSQWSTPFPTLSRSGTISSGVSMVTTTKLCTTRMLTTNTTTSHQSTESTTTITTITVGEAAFGVGALWPPSLLWWIHPTVVHLVLKMASAVISGVCPGPHNPRLEHNPWPMEVKFQVNEHPHFLIYLHPNQNYRKY